MTTNTVKHERWRKYAKVRAVERRNFLQDYKLGEGCVDCGYADHAEALQFDHVRGDKVRRLSGMVTWSWDKIFAEIDKCEVRCANCHSVVTAARRENLKKEMINV